MKKQRKTKNSTTGVGRRSVLAGAVVGAVASRLGRHPSDAPRSRGVKRDAGAPGAEGGHPASTAGESGLQRKAPIWIGHL